VNATFSVEIYIKAIHKVYGNNIRGHHLVNLYEELPREAKEIIFYSAQNIYPLYNLEQNKNIENFLQDFNKAFEEWRYLYEHDRLDGIEIQSLRYMMHVFFEACCRIKESNSVA
jgi:hypothetical protein